MSKEMKVFKEIKKIFEEHKGDVEVHCCEYHQHSALNGCLSGPAASVDICKMYELVQLLKGQIKTVIDKQLTKLLDDK